MNSWVIASLWTAATVYCCSRQSADNRTCLVKRSRNRFGDRCFVTAGPTLWNSLPELNSFGNRTSSSDNSNNRWKRLCLV